VKRIRKYRVKITPSGYVFILITILLSIGAANTGNNLLYLITSALLGVMLASGVSSILNLAWIELSVQPPNEIFAGIPAAFKVKIKRNFPFAAFFVSFKIKEGQKRGITLKGKEEKETTIWIKFKKRGKAYISYFVLYSGFPFGFFIREKRILSDLSFVVFPTPKAVPFSLSEGASSAGFSAAYQGDSDEIRGLRPYKDGDLLRWVDWRATARCARLISREFSKTQKESLFIRLTHTSEWEVKLQEATYLILEAHKRKIPYGIQLPEEEIPYGYGESHKIKILTSLALA